MSDKMRWRYGDTNPVVAAVDADTVIEIGDLVWQDVDDAKPASNLCNQEEFVAKFLGVAMQRSRVGEASPIRVATSGVFEFDCRSNFFELGDLVGPMNLQDEQFDTALLNQQIKKTIFASCALGRIAKRDPNALSVLVDIRSTVMAGGVLVK